MKIGYSVQGSTDRALLHGLRDRWCPQATLEPGAFRGTVGPSLRREFGKICEALLLKGVQAVVILTDADEADWRDVKRNEYPKLPAEVLHCAILGVTDRNVECWLCADPEWLGRKLGVSPDLFRCDDPKEPFKRAMGITRDEKKEGKIAALVAEAPLARWLASPSFEDFYEQVRDVSQQRGCSIENLREQ